MLVPRAAVTRSARRSDQRAPSREGLTVPSGFQQIVQRHVVTAGTVWPTVPGTVYQTWQLPQPAPVEPITPPVIIAAP